MVEGTLLADAVALWRKYVRSEDTEGLMRILQLVLSCLNGKEATASTVAEQTKRFLDRLQDFSLDMEELSHALGYSREHVTRSFVAAYRATPKQYLNRRRMNVALERLLSGAKVGEVADSLCYASAYSFSKAFKQHFGLSPVQYRHTLTEAETP